MKYIYLVAAILILLCSCTEAPAEPAVNIVTENNTELAEKNNPESVQTEEKVYDVSPLAQEQFLQPFEEYSWEREFPAEKIVLHFTSAVMLSRETPYDMSLVRSIFEDNKLSINYIIDRDGNIFCYMPESRCAWHAGVGTFGNEERYTNSMNKYSIGIELVAMGSQKDMAQYLTPSEYSALDSTLMGFTESQYEALDALIGDICDRNKIPRDRSHIIGHDEYNQNKSDPGELFDWDKVLPFVGK